MRTLIIIPASLKDAANALSKDLFDTVGGEYTFTSPLYPKNQNPPVTPSHYVCCAKFAPEKREILNQVAPSFSGSYIQDYDMKTNPAFPETYISSLNLKKKNPSISI